MTGGRKGSEGNHGCGVFEMTTSNAVENFKCFVMRFFFHAIGGSNIEP
jgi:hypothetical protein